MKQPGLRTRIDEYLSKLGRKEARRIILVLMFCLCWVLVREYANNRAINYVIHSWPEENGAYNDTLRNYDVIGSYYFPYPTPISWAVELNIYIEMDEPTVYGPYRSTYLVNLITGEVIPRGAEH